MPNVHLSAIAFYKCYPERVDQVLANWPLFNTLVINPSLKSAAFINNQYFPTPNTPLDKDSPIIIDLETLKRIHDSHQLIKEIGGVAEAKALLGSTKPFEIIKVGKHQIIQISLAMAISDVELSS